MDFFLSKNRISRFIWLWRKAYLLEYLPVTFTGDGESVKELHTGSKE